MTTNKLDIRIKISTSGIWTLDDDDLIRQIDLVSYKGAVWIYRFDHLGEATSTYIVKRRTRYVRMKDWFISGWAYGKWEFMLSLVTMALLPLWVLLVMLGL